MTLKYFLLALAILSTPTPSSRVWTDWHPAPPRLIAPMQIQKGCGAYECRLWINGQMYCFDEGQVYPTECCEFICDCDPDSYGLDCGWDMW